MKKMRWVRIVSVEVVIFIVLALVLYLPRFDKTFYADDIECQLGNNIGDALYVDAESSSGGWFINTSDMALDHGVYRISIEYESTADSSFIYFTSKSEQSSGIKNMDEFYSGIAYLRADRKSSSMDVYVNAGGSHYYTGCVFGGEGSLAVKSITIHKTMGGMLKGCIIYLVVVGTADLLLLFCDRRKRGQVKDEDIKVFFVLSLIVLFASFPLFVTFMINGHDALFHLARIEGIKEGILSGEFPIKIYSNWLCGNGYAAAVYYGDALLYIPALLRIAGFNLMESYNIFVFLCNAATCVISYYCFKGMSGSKQTAVVGAALYTTSIYRLIDIYVRSAAGEYAAMLFIPVVAYGMYRVYADETDEKDFSKNWVVPVIGFTGIINTHILTCEMAGIFTVLLCIVLFKRTFQKRRFLVLVKIVIYTCIVNVGFLLPFFHYFLQGGIMAVDVDRFANGIQQYGAYPAQIFEPFTTFSGLATTVDAAISEGMPVNVGAGLGFGGIVMVYVSVMGYVKGKKERVTAGVALAFAVLSIWMSTCIFPWNMLKGINGMISSIISNIQYPWRFLSIASIMLVVCIITALNCTRNYRRLYNGIAVVIVTANLVQGAVLMSGVLNNAEPYRVYQENDIDMLNAVIGAEYLPTGMLLQVYSAQYALPDDNINYSENYRKNNYIDCTIENKGDTEGSILFSLVYYDGYSAKDKDTGERLEVYKSEGRVAVRVRPGYSGTVVVEFTGFISWRIASGVSLVAALALLVCFMDRGGFITKKAAAFRKNRTEGGQRRQK